MKTKPSRLSRINLPFKTGKIRRKGEMGKIEEGSKRQEARGWNVPDKYENDLPILLTAHFSYRKGYC